MSTPEVAALTVYPAGGALIHEQPEKQLARLPVKSKSENEQTSLQTQKNKAKNQYRTSSSPAHVISEELIARARREESPWQGQIPRGAVFYDQMARIEVGLDRPGIVVSVRA